MPTEHEIADAGLDLLLDTASQFDGDENGDLTDEERELLWQIADAVEDSSAVDESAEPEPVQNATAGSKEQWLGEPSEDDRLQEPDQPISSETAAYGSSPTPPLSKAQQGHQFGGTA